MIRRGTTEPVRETDLVKTSDFGVKFRNNITRVLFRMGLMR